MSKGSTGWFNLDNEFLKIIFSTIELDFYKSHYKKDIEGQDMELYKTFLVPFDKESIKTQKVNNAPNLMTEPGVPSLEVIVVKKLQSDLYVNSVLTGETRASITTETSISKN